MGAFVFGYVATDRLGGRLSGVLYGVTGGLYFGGAVFGDYVVSFGILWVGLCVLERCRFCFCLFVYVLVLRVGVFRLVCWLYVLVCSLLIICGVLCFGCCFFLFVFFVWGCSVSEVLFMMPVTWVWGRGCGVCCALLWYAGGFVDFVVLYVFVTLGFVVWNFGWGWGVRCLYFVVAWFVCVVCLLEGVGLDVRLEGGFCFVFVEGWVFVLVFVFIVVALRFSCC